MKCPVCKANVKPGDEFCDNCGAVLSGATAAAVSARSISGGTDPGPRPAAAKNAAPSGPRICSNCGTSNSPSEEFCNNCGASLAVATPVSNSAASTATVAQAATTTACPRCGNLLTSSDRFCRKCGFNTSQLNNGASPTSRPTATTGVDPMTVKNVLKIGVGSQLGDKGRYTITREIGSGGMGAVFLAEDNLLKRKVVIKALLQSDDPEMVEASIKEREFLAAIKHPNVVQIYDFLQIDTDGYIVMEYVHGKTLYSMLEERGGEFPPAEAIHYTLGILPAFAYIHRLGLVYCDFKPQNIMLEEHPDGSKGVKLIDLGTVIKYEKDPAAVYGTQGFYAPEAVKHPSPETDLYTIARSLAYMVSLMDLDRPQFGIPPAEHYRVFRDIPILYRFLVKATHPVPSKRFQTDESMADQLAGVLRVIQGGQVGMPVTSKLFDSGSLSTGKLGTKEMATLDEKDKAYDLLKQGDQELKAGRPTQALAIYNQATGMNPNSVDAHLRLADLYMEREQYSQALSEITRVQKIDPNNWKIAWYTGRLLEGQGNLQAALDQYGELVQDVPGELPPLLALARVYAKMGNYRDSVDTFRLVSKASPDNTDALFGISNGLMNQQQWGPAAEALAGVSEGSARYLDAQQAICDLFLYQKRQNTGDDLLKVSRALSNLESRGNDSLPFLLSRADFYRQATQLALAGKLPNQFSLPTRNLDATPVMATPSRQQLGRLAEESYDQYLKRLPPNDPVREQIVRQKFQVAPWRVI